MTDHLQHICTESECCYTGQPSPKGCGCHQTREQMSAARLERLEAINAELLAGMRQLYRGYINTLESGRDRILMLGGDCDAIDRMEEGDPALIKARATIAKAIAGEAGNGAS